MVAFQRREENAVTPPKCFGFVQPYDQKPRWPFWGLMKSQGMQEKQPEDAAAVSQELESIKHPLRYGNVDETLERLTHLLLGPDLIGKHFAAAKKMAACLAEFETCIRNNEESIQNYDKRCRPGADDLDRVRRIIHQPGAEAEICQETTDTLDTARSAPVFANAAEGFEQRIGRNVWAVVPAILRPNESRVTTGPLLLS